MLACHSTMGIESAGEIAQMQLCPLMQIFMRYLMPSAHKLSHPVAMVLDEYTVIVCDCE